MPTLAAVIGFGSSDALAGAYGIAVSLLMAITTLMATFVALHWKHNSLLVYGVNGSLPALDLLFFVSTSTKLADGAAPCLLALGRVGTHDVGAARPRRDRPRPNRPAAG